MGGPSNRETLKLLEISDDSKSLSDLDLPEISSQRKRKVRRKTRPKPSSHRSQDVSNSNQCNRLIVWVAIFLTCCWLLTLSYMIAVIHSENLRLEKQIKKLAVTSQNLPEALQKWHETSKNLEQNQTIIYGKISELQHSLENLSADFSHYKQQLNEKKDYSKDEKLVADFGAKIVAVSVDVEGMKDRLREFQKDQTEFKNELQDVKSNFSKVLISAAAVNNNNQTTNCSEEISQLQKVTLEQIKSLSSNMSLINDTLSQKVQILVKDIAGHKQNLDDLSEINANTTSHVSSIEKDWMEVKEKFKECEKYKIETNSEIAKVRNATQYLGSSVEDIGSKCGKYHVELINFMNQFKSNPITEAPVNNEGPVMYIQSDKQATSNSDHKTTQRMDLTPLNSSEPLHMSN